MKQLPNIITLSNLFFGCCAIVFTLTAYPYLITVGAEGQYMQIQGMEKMYYASIFIGLAAIMDMFDGMAARLLKVDGNFGKDLDSLADVVSFGVAPGIIIYQLLWRSYMMEPGALETPFLLMAPALLLPCFGAYRLATFNQTSNEQKSYFIGMPIPAVGIFVAIFPLVLFFEYDSIGFLLEKRIILYSVIAILCYLMISKHKFLKWSTGNPGIAGHWPQIVIALGTLASSFFLGWGALLVGFLLYVICSFFYSYPVVEKGKAAPQ